MKHTIPDDCQDCSLRSVDRCKKTNRSIKRMASTGTPCPLDGQVDGVRQPGQFRTKPFMDSANYERDVRLYTESTNLAIVSCFFNPQQFQNPVDNYHRYYEGLGDLQKHLWTIELAFDEDPFQLPAGPQMLRVRGQRSRHNLWQKERLLNLAAAQVPLGYGSIAYSDSDFIYENPLWYEQAREALLSSEAVQLFSDIVWLGSEPGTIAREQRKSWAGAISQRGKPGEGLLSPGGAWAFKRAFWPIPDSHIMGGGDTLLLWSMLGRIDHGSLGNMSDSWARSWAAGSVEIFKKIRSRVSAVDGRVSHLFHGDLADRQYHDRWKILRESEFDPAIDIETDPETGIWQWSDVAIETKPEMVSRVADYFKKRNEDG